MNCREPIQQRIRDLGLTQRAVSHAMGVTDQSLSNFLNGSRTYSYLAYVKLLKVLGLTLGHEGDNIGTVPVRNRQMNVWLCCPFSMMLRWHISRYIRVSAYSNIREKRILKHSVDSTSQDEARHKDLYIHRMHIRE